ncbi:hypothetical protein HYFRA_00001353 [Hymenoscyphus fraxineus]|uniref:CFEM domain-containing protein n=1 Tax=Hymenoscyphus fraxineus TaxID=746836 RepID=A0A9N9L398_9HELO|nr:hypothetical protein HYFRA_00001353 [Hymenoscyphus fraxineus]
MKWIQFTVLLAFVPRILAQDASSLQLVASLPTCGLQCLVTSVQASSCSLTNTTCVCTNEPLQAVIASCVASSCTIKESLTVKNITDGLCHVPLNDKSASFEIIVVTMGVFTGMMVALRMVSAYILGISLYADDYTILITFISGIPSSVLLGHFLPKNGIGRDIWHVPFDQITEFVHIFYAAEVLYFAQVALLKIGLLLFYLRIFSKSKIGKYIHGTIVLNIIVGVTFIIAALFQCQPINYNWNRWDGEHSGKCVNINAVSWANSALSILLDAWMLALPMSQLATLQLHWKKKIGVAMMFMVGAFVTVISILRLRTLVIFGSSQNPTWDNYEVGVWSDLEINVGIICTCMPCLRLLLVRMFPKIFGGSVNRSTNYAKNYASNNDRSQFGTKKSGARRQDDADDVEILRESVEMARIGPLTPTSHGDTKTGFKIQQQDV